MVNKTKAEIIEATDEVHIDVEATAATNARSEAAPQSTLKVNTQHTARYGRCISPAVRGLEEGHVGWSAPLWKEEGDSREFRIGHRRGHAAGERRWRRLPLCSPAPSFLPAVNINTSDATGEHTDHTLQS
ncbi:hypothetical protein LXL04_017694 [Taraxacum kok-saghyz]